MAPRLRTLLLSLFMSLVLVVFVLKINSRQTALKQSEKTSAQVLNAQRPQSGLNTESSDVHVGAAPSPRLAGGGEKRAEVSQNVLDSLRQAKIQNSSKGNPFRLTGKIPWEPLDGETEDQTLARYMAAAAPLLGIDHPEQLSLDRSQAGTLGLISVMKQDYDGVPVDGSQVRVHRDADGSIFMVNSTFINGVGGVQKTPTLSPGLASAQVRQQVFDENARLGFRDKLPEISAPKLVIHIFSQRGPDLSWKFSVNQPWQGAPRASMNYFVHAHIAGVIESVTLAHE